MIFFEFNFKKFEEKGPFDGYFKEAEKVSDKYDGIYKDDELDSISIFNKNMKNIVVRS